MAHEKITSAFKWTYKTLRSIIFSAVVTVAVIFAVLYATLSVPSVQEYIKERIESELITLFGQRVEIGRLTVRPLNEAIVEDLVLTDPNGEECLKVGRLGAGINLWRLITSGEIEITYVELLKFKAKIYQQEKNAPLNIDFIIKALAPKDKSKPKTKFNLKIHNIVIRGGDAAFDRRWQPEGAGNRLDPNHIEVTGLSGDITIPRLSDTETEIDLRRLSFAEKSGLQVKDLGGIFAIGSDKIKVADFNLSLPETVLRIKPFEVPFALFDKKHNGEETIRIEIADSRVTPSNLAAFLPALSEFDFTMPLSLTASGNTDHITVTHLQFGDRDTPRIELTGDVTGLSHPEKFIAGIKELKAETTGQQIYDLLESLQTVKTDKKLLAGLPSLGETVVTVTGNYNNSEKRADFTTTITTLPGELTAHGDIDITGDHILGGELTIEIPSFKFTSLLPDLPLEGIDDATLKIEGKADTSDLLSSQGSVELNIGNVEMLNRSVSAIEATATKNGDLCSLRLNIDDLNLNGEMEGMALLDGADTHWEANAIVRKFDTYSSFIDESSGAGYELKGNISLSAYGNTVDNITGDLNLHDFQLRKWNGKELGIDRLDLAIRGEEEGRKEVILMSNIADLNLNGNFIPSKIPGMVKRTLHEVSPALFRPFDGNGDCGEGRFELEVKDANPLIEFFDLKIFPLTELEISGSFDSRDDSITLSTDIPFIQQGDNKLITGTYLDMTVKGSEAYAQIMGGTVYPTKKGLLKTDLDLTGRDGHYAVGVDFNKGRNVAFSGSIALDLDLWKDEDTGKLGIRTDWLPSTLHLNEAEWRVEESQISFSPGLLQVKDFCIRHDDQYVIIRGYNNQDGEGTLRVLLNEMNLDYVFDTLNIPHVTFGGIATGEITAQGIFGNDPVVRTETLRARDFSYNGALLGDGDLRAALDLPGKNVKIGAIVKENGKTVADVDGGVWFGRDSLSFNFKADSVNIGFMQPFMAAFSSDVRGRASGEAHLYGTFSDIDMTGTIVADKVDILIDYINARYIGSDTVYMTPGRIDIPGLTVSDRYGHTAKVAGELTHRCFHDPVFRFRVTEMDRLLVYDTNAKMNPLWYGIIFASGNGEISGRPGIVRIAADVETAPGSDFTFVLSDQQEAVKSNFLTFTDKRKAEAEAAMPKDTVPEFLSRFRKEQKQEDASSDVFTMDFRVSVTDDVRFNLIMDPVAGDKITAYGAGAMTMTYNSLTDQLRLYGKYILEKGTYNFSLQDIILKEFIIKPGSSIAFTGDPYTGVLDITAAYRVNTSLTELDRSFASDRELNRTSVPVEALLKVTGQLTTPNIGFDIELPTVTEETAQKVRSIISTEDMMSRQVLYLIALNKFYPPEYMATSNSGGEWASIASSTLSSQVQNMIGQITDKFTLAPSIRSDKGDFSDIEVDLALSSQLFNNRLLINGNLGYRDPSNSSTTFVGDFDLEYLLNRKGTWRLKAYNHFNDQNYYLKSALTTQGIGIVWRKDFGTPRKPEDKEESKEEEPAKNEIAD